MVEESFKRDLGKKVEIWTSDNGGTCGYGAHPGARHAMVLYDRSRDAGRFGRSLERETEPLRRFAEPPAALLALPALARAASACDRV